MTVFISEPISPVAIRFLEDKGYTCKMASSTDEDVMIREAAGCVGAVTRAVRITRRFLEGVPSLKVIGKSGVGLDNVDLAAATELGVRITYGPLTNYVPVAEDTIALMLEFAKRNRWMEARFRAGDWHVRDTVLPTELWGKTVGIIGFGRIGRTVAQICAQGFHMDVAVYQSRVDPASVPDYVTLEPALDDLLARSDYVTLHCPATPETAGLIDAHALSVMKPTAVLINCARGAVVDQRALCEAIREGSIAGAGLDVFDREPPDPDDPIFQLDNVIVTPHCAALTAEAYERMGLAAAAGVDEVLTGKPVSWPAN